MHIFIDMMGLELTDMRDEKAFAYSLQPSSRIAFLIYYSLSLAVGTLGKCVVYLDLIQSKLADRPLNILILVDQLVHQVFFSYLLLTMIVSLLLNVPVGDLLSWLLADALDSRMVCMFHFVVTTFILAWMCVVSLGMAIYRLLYIHKNIWVKYTFGEAKLLYLTLFFIVAVALLITFIYASEGFQLYRNRTIYNICTGRSIRFQEILIQYETGHSFTDGNYSVPIRLILLLVIALRTAEAGCYTFFFVCMIKQTMRIATLPFDRRKKRHQKNVISMAGQMYCFIGELVFYLFMIMAVFLGNHFVSDDAKELGFLIKIGEYGLLQMIVVITSPGPRKMLKRLLSRHS